MLYKGAHYTVVFAFLYSHFKKEEKKSIFYIKIALDCDRKACGDCFFYSLFRFFMNFFFINGKWRVPF